jgi:hypothetical protein
MGVGFCWVFCVGCVVGGFRRQPNLLAVIPAQGSDTPIAIDICKLE